MADKRFAPAARPVHHERMISLALFVAALAASPAPAPCPLVVRFGSYAMGIDHAAAARIHAFLEKRREVGGDRTPALGPRGRI